METSYINAYVRKDYTLEGIYRIETYEPLLGYWTTSEPLTLAQAREMVKCKRVKVLKTNTMCNDYT